jgi:type II secretory pathway component GspD/PulD (secretin)
MTMTRLIAVLSFAVAALAAGSTGSAARAQAENEPNKGVVVGKVVRVYDVRELTHSVPNYPYYGNISPRMNTTLGALMIPGINGVSNGGGGGGNLFAGGVNAAAPAGQQATAEQLAKIIMETIQPDTWRDNGGDVGTIKQLNGMLIVTHNAAAQQQIEELLRQFRDQQGRVVRISAHWLLLKPEQAQTLFTANDPSGTALRTVDRDVMAKLPADVVHLRGETCCFSGQTVHVVSSRIRNVIADFNPVVGTQAVGIDPTVTLVETGAALQVTSSVQSDGKSATLDLHSVLTEGEPAGERELRGAAAVPATQKSDLGASASPIMDRVNLLSQELHTSLRVPVGKLVAIGGMTAEPTAKSGDGAEWILLIELIASPQQ